jgi:hypothetical protein
MQTYARSITYDLETMIPLWVEEVPYDGEWAMAKKGRESQQKVTDTALSNAGTDTSRRTDQYNSGNKILGEMTADSTPGSLSPAASAQLAADQRKIQDTYQNAGQVGLKRIAQHGMGTLTGEASSLNNSLLHGQASDEVAAHENALMNTQGMRERALSAEMGLQNTYNPNADLGTGSESAYRQSQSGSTLGDIGKGLTSAASVGSGIVGMGGLNNLPGNIMNGIPKNNG